MPKWQVSLSALGTVTHVEEPPPAPPCDARRHVSESCSTVSGLGDRNQVQRDEITPLRAWWKECTGTPASCIAARALSSRLPGTWLCRNVLDKVCLSDWSSIAMWTCYLILSKMTFVRTYFTILYFTHSNPAVALSSANCCHNACSITRGFCNEHN